MPNRVFYGDDILKRAQSPAIKGLFVKWRTLSQLRNVTLTDLFEGGTKNAGQFTIMLVVEDNYYYIYQGANYRQMVGFNLDGTFITDRHSRVSREMRDIFDQVRDTGIPIYFIYASEMVGQALAFERIVIPITVAGEVRLLLAFSEPINSTLEVHDYLFGTAPNMLIAALPILDHDEGVLDADIVLINPAAMAFFETDRFKERPIRMRELTPWFNNGETWQLLTGRLAAEDGERVLQESHAGAAYRLVVRKLDQVLLFNIAREGGQEFIALE